MPGAIEPLQRSAGTRTEVERQLAAAAERHREMVASMQEPGRPASGQHVAVKAVGRAVHLVVFALRRAADEGVPVERLMELTGWEPKLVDDALARASEPSVVARLAPVQLPPVEVDRVASGIDATERLHDLTQRILADVGDEAWSPDPADVVDLRERLDGEWRSWSRSLGRPQA